MRINLIAGLWVSYSERLCYRTKNAHPNITDRGTPGYLGIQMGTTSNRSISGLLFLYHLQQRLRGYPDIICEVLQIYLTLLLEFFNSGPVGIIHDHICIGDVLSSQSTRRPFRSIPIKNVVSLPLWYFLLLFRSYDI